MIPFPKKKYNIIYADPAWYFKTYSDKGNKRSAVQHYDCMSIDDICNLPINSICDDDCMLFLWVIDPMLPEAIKVIESWGFKYKTVAFTWVKKNKKSDNYFTGMGYYTRSNPEMCLLATKGKPKRISKSVRQLIVSKLQEHSKKPDCVRNKIVELCGDLSRIELFARNRYKGWDSWGNQI
tara:strand:+ start:226 stop:765 length:540 start_codon:yes stop_codon:yes gene_type:complete